MYLDCLVDDKSISTSLFGPNSNEEFPSWLIWQYLYVEILLREIILRFSFVRDKDISQKLKKMMHWKILAKEYSNSSSKRKQIFIQYATCERANGSVVVLAAASLPARAQARGAHQTPAPEQRGWRETQQF
jgi:hypothetical protein